MYENQVRQPVAVEVMQFAHNLNQRATLLSERVNEKLHSVMISDYPRECTKKPAPNSAEYPPLFSDLYENLQGIEIALTSIEHALSRTEL